MDVKLESQGEVGKAGFTRIVSSLGTIAAEVVGRIKGSWVKTRGGGLDSCT